MTDQERILLAALAAIQIGTPGVPRTVTAVCAMGMERHGMDSWDVVRILRDMEGVRLVRRAVPDGTEDDEYGWEWTCTDDGLFALWGPR